MPDLTIRIERNGKRVAPRPFRRVARPPRPVRTYTPPVQRRESTVRLVTTADEGPRAGFTAAMILGGGQSVWRDVAVLETMIEGFWPGIVIAVNDVGCVWPRKLDHWVTLHPEKLLSPGGWKNPEGRPNGWGALRDKLGHPGGYKLWTNREKRRYGPEPHHVVRQWASGSSGLLAVAAAYQLGCERVILCGVPMDDRPHFQESVVHDPRRNWTSVRSHWRAWTTHMDRIKERTRSMSGRTRQVLGKPTLAWLGIREPQRRAA